MKRFLLVIILLGLCTLFSCTKTVKKGYTKLEGHAFGTAFSINYDDKVNYSIQIDSLFYLLNKSLSTYIPTSDISRINLGDSTLIIDSFFLEVFQKAKRIHIETERVFDPTIGVLVNAWGFGPNGSLPAPDSAKVKELLKKVGFEKIYLIDGRLRKEIDGMYLDFNAIAKGYAVDIVGRFLESKAVDNYLIEIGGEIRARGTNALGAQWKAGIEDPNTDGSRSINRIIKLDNESIATSGSYRKFKIDSLSGQKFVHIIDPKTGYPRAGNLLSVSIIGKIDCADTDAYATALMAMSLEDAIAFLDKRPKLKGFIIFSDKSGELKTYSSLNL